MESNFRIDNAGGNLSNTGIIGNNNSVERSKISVDESTEASQELLSKLCEIQTALTQGFDLPSDEARELKEDLDSVINTTQSSKPKKERLLNRLHGMQKTLDGMKNTVNSANSLVKLIGEAITIATSIF